MILTEGPMGPGFFIFFQYYERTPAGTDDAGLRERDNKDILEIMTLFLNTGGNNGY